MAFALRCLFFLLVLALIALFLYLYRRRTNQILLVLLAVYGVSVGSRLMTLERDDELVVQSALAIGGLAVVWGIAWLGGKWWEGRGPREPD